MAIQVAAGLLGSNIGSNSRLWFAILPYILPLILCRVSLGTLTRPEWSSPWQLTVYVKGLCSVNRFCPDVHTVDGSVQVSHVFVCVLTFDCVDTRVLLRTNLAPAPSQCNVIGPAWLMKPPEPSTFACKSAPPIFSSDGAWATFASTISHWNNMVFSKYLIFKVWIRRFF